MLGSCLLFALTASKAHDALSDVNLGDTPGPKFDVLSSRGGLGLFCLGGATGAGLDGVMCGQEERLGSVSGHEDFWKCPLLMEINDFSGRGAVNPSLGPTIKYAKPSNPGWDEEVLGGGAEFYPYKVERGDPDFQAQTNQKSYPYIDSICGQGADIGQDHGGGKMVNSDPDLDDFKSAQRECADHLLHLLWWVHQFDHLFPHRFKKPRLHTVPSRKTLKKAGSFWLIPLASAVVLLFYHKRPCESADSQCPKCGLPSTTQHQEACRHRWFNMGFCDDLYCPEGEIWRCLNCRLWFCDGPCNRFGTQRPPLLNHIQEATVSALEHTMELLVRHDVPWEVILILLKLATADAVTCRTCFDQVTGCTGGDACPFLTTAAANGVLLIGGAVAAGAATALVARDIFPLRFTRVLHRGILDSLLLVGRRPPPGTPVDISALTTAQLSDPVSTAGVELDTLLQEVASRLAAAGTQMEISRLNAITTNLTARRKLHSGAQGAVDLGDGTSTIVGVYRYCVVLALRIVRTKHTDVAVVTEGEKAGSEAEGSSSRAVPPAKLSRPVSMAEFSAVLTVWTMLLAGLGVAPLLVSGAFLMDVVYDHINENTVSWQTAFELFLVYLEEVERTPGDEINLTNVYNRGAQDTFMRRARERTPKASLSDKERDIFRTDGVEWNGSWNRKSASTCITFNLGNKKHPASSLNERGGCKFNHACDQWVSDKGPHGRCGGDHPRVKCDNPNKCDKELK